jgi:hypothetical protein
VKIQVTGEQSVGEIEVNGGQPSRIIDVTAGLVSSVNGRTGGVTGLAEAADVPGIAETAAETAVTAHVAATDPHGDRAWAAATFTVLGWANVMHYGATGDGVTDDTAAIQAAINAASVVYLPAGKTFVAAGLTPRAGTVLIGGGAAGFSYQAPAPASMVATLKLRDGANTHLIVGADGVSQVQLRNLRLDGNKANNASGDLIHLTAAAAQDTAWHIVDCTLDNAPRDGIHIGSGRQAIKVNRMWIMRSANAGAVIDGPDCGFDTVLIGLSGNFGIYVGIGANVQHITDCDIWSSGQHGVVVDQASMISLTGVGIDRHQRSGLVVLDGDVTVRGCFFHGNSQAGSGLYPHIRVDKGNVAVVGCIFGGTTFVSNPNWAIQATAPAVIKEAANVVLNTSVTSGYISDTSRVVNTITGDMTATGTLTTGGAITSGGSVSLGVAHQVNVGSSGSSASFAAQRANATDGIISGRASGDTVNRYGVTAAGSHTWGPGGSTAADVTLARSGTNALAVTGADFRIATAGRGLRVAEGANAKMGVAALAAGTVTVSTTAVTANSRIFLTCQTPGGTPGFLRVSARTAGTSFTILSSSGTDTSVVAWMIVEPA